MKKIILFAVYLLLFITPPKIFAQNHDKFITVVNPVRISTTNNNPKKSLDAEYYQVSKRGLPATWLLTYDVIENPGIQTTLKEMDNNQELGVFLEVSQDFAQKSGVIYNQTDSWHRATSVFLSGYSKLERIKLIDTVFTKFKANFGYYPTSVGAWWLDSDSLNYMVDKYHITANLGCFDQFSTDGYKLWGQPWTTIYYSSKFNPAIPASSLQNKLGIVTLLWAPRDPLYGYGPDRASLYSTQDYFTLNLGIDYFKNLIDIYTKNSNFGQITLGLEGDLLPESYSQTYSSWLDTITDYHNTMGYKVLTMSALSNLYKQEFPNISPSSIIQNDNNLDKKSIWYTSPFYRINIVYDKILKKIIVKDFRDYFSNFQDPYVLSINKQLDLDINVPSIIDAVINPAQELQLTNLKLQQESTEAGDFYLKFENNKVIVLKSSSLNFINFSNSEFDTFKTSKYLKIDHMDNTTVLTPINHFPIETSGYIFSDLNPQSTNFINQKKVKFTLLIFAVLIVSTFLFLKLRQHKINRQKIKIYRLGIVGVIILFFCIEAFWYNGNSQTYYVSQSEMDALYQLSSMLPGKVLVLDKDCLQCKYHLPQQPAVFANKRSYVSKISHHPLVSNTGIFNTSSRQEAKRQLVLSQAKYIYLVGYEDYQESMPFSPGDLGVEKIYQNNNAQIWKVIQ